jgi:CTP synthase (UTP-ammonia lyase)
MGIRDAGHLESDPNTATPLIVLVSCPVPERAEGASRLSGRLKIKITPDSLASSIYQFSEVEEEFNCNYELNPSYRSSIEDGGMRVTGVGENGETRIVELSDHSFFLATAFQPHFSSEKGRPHPLISAFLKAALSFGSVHS